MPTLQNAALLMLHPMREIKGERRQRILVLSKRLEELSTARRELFCQLEDLDTQLMSVNREHNTLVNLEAPISILPDEVLTMIFEAGMVPKPDSLFYFEQQVAHVSHHWREIALLTSRLWASIECSLYQVHPSNWIMQPDYIPLARERMIERASTYLLRSRSIPVTIHIIGLREGDFNPDFLLLIGDHIGHCLRLFIEQVPSGALQILYEYLQPKSAPQLEFFGLNARPLEDEPMQFQQPFFSSGAPRLTTALFGSVEPEHLQFFTSAFASVTSLCITRIEITDDEQYQMFRHALMDMKSLYHLSLLLESFPTLPGSSSSIILPTVQVLAVCCAAGEAPYTINCLESIHAVSLRSLLLDGGASEQTEPLGRQFPSLTSLTLVETSADDGSALVDMARRFPDIERLTCRIRRIDQDRFGIDHIIGAILWGPNDEDDPESKPCPLWPKLHSLAVNASGGLMMTGWPLTESILTLQKLGHPIRKLLLPKAVLSRVRMSLKEVVDLNEFCDDFPKMLMWQ